MAVGPEITQNRKGNVDPLAPGFEAGKVICQHTQDLGVQLDEEVLKLFVRSKLTRSDRCKRRRQKAEQHIPIPPVITEGYPVIIHARECKIRGLVPYPWLVGRFEVRNPDV